ncbi:hypothetical protein [Streptomyces albireticuli]|uniref:Uncharacterized protein n=1 Tax=Streptomyces albireticuli TaxID=1940 RepID=A0A2A2DD17_9ACTN|nr:hypothetical protein [Streptomyces albireticuli]MCD9144976.1 hypothetical protein [Streptomyces albireticuli]MCD9164402.1 hypothetical protein [Streptomyces albireticuli]MCD9194113.1 hypothetical protein [Streptomyces albireticuli]PAU49405.1 hypothetical protein CK936_08095 [Streptomyces albireticuli]
MEAIWTSVVAVGGTLLGAVVTQVFQRLASRRGELFARSEALRQERMATFSAFAAAAEEYRHGQADRWYRMRQDPGGQDFVTARDEAHRLRTATRQVLYRIKLLTDDPEVIRAAERAYACTRDVSTAGDQPERDGLDARARDAIEAFVARAAPLVHRPSPR